MVIILFVVKKIKKQGDIKMSVKKADRTQSSFEVISNAILYERTI